MIQGQTVYVRWYGKVLEGRVVKNTTPDDPLLGRMVAVDIPIQDTTATALFTPASVYLAPPSQAPKATANSPCQSDAVTKREETTLLALKHFKQEHWDHKRNHLKVGSLDDFYILWRCAYGGHRQEADTQHHTINLITPLSKNTEAVPQNETPSKPVKKVTQLSLFD